jgi:hypothetical protein
MGRRFFALLGAKIIVSSFAPSRIGIIARIAVNVAAVGDDGEDSSGAPLAADDATAGAVLGRMGGELPPAHAENRKGATSNEHRIILVA